MQLKILIYQNFQVFQKSGYYDYLNIIDSLLLTSRQDSFPLVMIEANFLGKPILSFDSGGSTEFIIKNKTGNVCNSWNASDMLDHMMELYRNRDSYEPSNIKKTVTNYLDNASVENKLINIINLVLNTGKQSD